jgi:adenine phosphoribosyltransferase
MTDLKAKVREVQDFPTPGVGFKDVTPLLADPQLLRETVGELAEWVRSKDVDVVLGAEARGFWIG